MINQFEGMSEELFTYDDYEAVRAQLIDTIHARLTETDRAFLLGIKNLEPDWSLYDFQRFPAVQWKLQNLRRLKESNPEKHRQQYEALHRALHGHR